jgi:hypothetical protein
MASDYGSGFAIALIKQRPWQYRTALLSHSGFGFDWQKFKYRGLSGVTGGQGISITRPCSARAFSSEVETGLREESAIEQEDRAPI